MSFLLASRLDCQGIILLFALCFVNVLFILVTKFEIFVRAEPANCMIMNLDSSCGFHSAMRLCCTLWKCDTPFLSAFAESLPFGCVLSFTRQTHWHQSPTKITEGHLIKNGQNQFTNINSQVAYFNYSIKDSLHCQSQSIKLTLQVTIQKKCKKIKLNGFPNKQQYLFVHFLVWERE